MDPRLGGAANEWPRGWSIRITSHWQNWRTRPPHQPARSLGQNQYGGLPRNCHCHGPQNLPLNLYQRPLFCLWERVPPRRNAVIPLPVRRPQEGLRHPRQTNDYYRDLSKVPMIPVETPDGGENTKSHRRSKTGCRSTSRRATPSHSQEDLRNFIGRLYANKPRSGSKQRDLRCKNCGATEPHGFQACPAMNA